MAHEAISPDIIPHPADIDLTAEAFRRVHWPKVVLIGSLKRAFPKMVDLYRRFGDEKVDALVPWAFFEDPENLGLREGRWTSIAEKLVVETHLLRIKSSDIAYVVNPEGYVGANSIIDIGAALEAGKKVYTMEDIADNGIAVMMSGTKTPEEVISMAQEFVR